MSIYFALTILDSIGRTLGHHLADLRPPTIWEGVLKIMAVYENMRYEQVNQASPFLGTPFETPTWNCAQTP